MKIQCPRCKMAIPADQINMSTDLAYCPDCGTGFKISDALDLGDASAAVLQDPPPGAWYRQELDGFVVGASTRSPAAFWVVPLMIVWSGGSLAGFFGTQIVKGEFDLRMSLCGIPFLLGSIFFWGFALMPVCGKVEVWIGDVSRVFVGIGKFGRTRYFDWASVSSIYEGPRQESEYGTARPIVIEGAKRLEFGTILNKKRKHFVLYALRSLLKESRTR